MVKKLLLSVLLGFSVNASANCLYYDMGDDWVEEVSDFLEAFEYDWMGYGNGLCYSGDAEKVRSRYFILGDSDESNQVGHIEIVTSFVKDNEIRLSYVSSIDGLNRVNISKCSEDLDLP